MADRLTGEQLAEIRERAEKATAGPWYDEAASGFVIAAKDESGCNDETVCQFWRKSDETDFENASNNRPFIAHARTDIPALLADRDALVADLRNAEGWIADVEEREAAVCPEDVGFDECIRALETELQEAREQTRTAQANVEGLAGVIFNDYHVQHFRTRLIEAVRNLQLPPSEEELVELIQSFNQGE